MPKQKQISKPSKPSKATKSTDNLKELDNILFKSQLSIAKSQNLVRFNEGYMKRIDSELVKYWAGTEDFHIGKSLCTQALKQIYSDNAKENVITSKPQITRNGVKIVNWISIIALQQIMLKMNLIHQAKNQVECCDLAIQMERGNVHLNNLQNIECLLGREQKATDNNCRLFLIDEQIQHDKEEASRIKKEKKAKEKLEKEAREKKEKEEQAKKDKKRKERRKSSSEKTSKSRIEKPSKTRRSK